MLSSLSIESAQDQARDASLILAGLTQQFPEAESAREASRLAEAVFDPSDGILISVNRLVNTIATWVGQHVPPGADSGLAYDLWHRLAQAGDDFWDLAEALASTSYELEALQATALASLRAQAARAASPTAATTDLPSPTTTTTAPTVHRAPPAEHTPTR